MKLFLILLFISISFSQEWFYDIDAAQEEANKSNKKIILVFQGSDWCAPCMKLEKKIWQTDDFKVYAKKHFVMLKADFPRKEEHQLSDDQKNKNKLLAEKYNKYGYFPFVVILDSDGNVIGETGYKKMKPLEYIEHLESFKSSH